MIYKLFLLNIFLLCFSLTLFSYNDESHFSRVFNEERSFRIFTPPDYNPLNQARRYPVIYYFHGCGGSYEKSGTYSYADFGLTPPSVTGRKHDPAYDYSSNADFENYTYNNNVIIICVDGKINGLDGCGVYFPSQAKDWKGNYYNFSLYIRELFDVVDSRYNTKKGPQFRAISGLSMGGNTAIWIAATNPHLFSSASEFCHSPNFYDVGETAYSTTVDVQQLWRNLRALPFRHTTTTGDYIKYYTTELHNAFKGAGFDNEYHMAEFCNHHAAGVDLQFDFHMRLFGSEKKTIPCFSAINLYPEFETWGYEVKSDKNEAGWIYLRNVSKNGAGIYTRKKLPWGRSLSEFKISVFTPPVYIPGEEYKLVHYSYKKNEIWEEKTRADRNGKLVLTTRGGAGEEIGITGKELQPPVILLTDTINENIYLENNCLRPLTFEILNLSGSAQLVEISAASESTDILSFTRHTSTVLLQAGSKTKVDSMLICKALISSPDENRAFIRISMKAGGVILDREHILPVVVKSRTLSDKGVQIKIFDGRSEELPVFKYAWNEWDRPLNTAMISEGKGNGNGKAEPGEIFSIWVQLPDAYDPRDTDTWHPVIPINNANNPGVVLEDIAYHSFSTGRSLMSAMIRLDKKPSEENPLKFAVQSELLWTEVIDKHCHRPVADGFGYAYLNIHISEDGTASIIRQQ
ncbi:MAG: hypothetical protein A2X05_11570 [Bacteroidetes bacterium GWE2_41_25]|nr:MAG: hypothetical protein A2X03_00030 [Bacteroidetes bacterium GWA2_40_15]OFX96160.1 MAG: hypothetical protein A2X05_11570 [Bacteroidetes bacterium GWE2_41_25]OFY01552.1 MAG: hypothetical protein A2X06_03650 [Bacteroidetes bacterium GWC2_40_22]OFY60575.1 MAG: hypothetical protein A2X04_08625 [Bacteroidetes bacterium GWF2_41_9]